MGKEHTDKDDFKLSAEVKTVREAKESRGIKKKEKTDMSAAFVRFLTVPASPHPMNKNLQKYEGADDPVSAPPPIKKGAELGFLHAALKSDISNNIIEDDDDCQSDQIKSKSRV